MDRNRTRGIALAVLALVAVALVAGAAAPLFAQETETGSPMYEMDSLESIYSSPERFDVSGIVSIFDGIKYAVFAIVAIAIVVQFVTDPWGAFKKALVGAGIATIGVLIVWYRYNVFEPKPPERNVSVPMNGTPVNGSAGFNLGESDVPLIPTDSLGVVAIVAGGLGVITLLAWRSGRLQSMLGVPGIVEEQDGEPGALGEVAGRAADDVENAATATAADNAIYRAWSEMVALLDAPDPQSGTPRQFAAAAIEAGMDPEQVDVLTRAFEEVRYGDAALSEERRERATEALRRIEAANRESEGVDGSAVLDREDSARGASEGVGSGGA